MKHIVCNLNLFTHLHTIYLYDGDDIKVIGVADIDHLPQIIAATCQQEQTYNVHLYGAGNYPKEIAEEILKVNETNYSNFTINIEVN